MRLILLALLICTFSFAKTPLRVASEIEEGILEDMQQINSARGPVNELQATHLRKYMDNAVNMELNVAYGELIKAGHQEEAEGMMFEWENMYGGTIWQSRGIGAHKPLSQWLADKYNVIEGILGINFCQYSHISDLKSLNFGVPVTIHPCTFSMDAITGERIDEYRRHVCGHSIKVQDEPYYGVVPVVTYWAVYIGCAAGTAGTGFALVCGMAGDFGEKIIANYVAPGLSDDIYNKACGGH